VRLSVDYEREDFDVLESIARSRQTSVASIIRQAVRDYIRRVRGK
jgi:predicted DNA-binding ribbon-helix-helix protein